MTTRHIGARRSHADEVSTTPAGDMRGSGRSAGARPTRRRDDDAALGPCPGRPLERSQAEAEVERPDVDLGGGSRRRLEEAACCAQYGPPLLGRSNSRAKASCPALVSISASRIRERRGVSSGKDSSSSATGRPRSGGGRFDSEGGTMISTETLVIRQEPIRGSNTTTAVSRCRRAA